MNLIDRQDTDFLNFIGQLPPQDNYIPVQSFNRGAWYWVDKNTPYLQIISPAPHPWGKIFVLSEGENVKLTLWDKLLSTQDPN